ncbi:alpha-amylase family glycosyl hydrolase [Rhodohalobacter sp. 614A]|uniref:alpha-amylase family glycosyl hydrolase n=1 Tax=Rhodohalobacter sp. 614A TaxID=2908649 RepID=UPI001F39D2F2|nr:alpha-amylase family glycosyl hydrolase [Rhodohalobacter sp. 614A]
MPKNIFCENTLDQLQHHFTVIYGKDRVDECIKRTKKLVQKYNLKPSKKVSFHDVWTHKDHILITYGDMIQPSRGEPISKLRKQHQFLKESLSDTISSVHILPFFPSSSDDGFSVVEYRRVDERLGGWDDIGELSKDFRLMADLVMNHASRYSEWFKKYLRKEEKYKDYFIEIDPAENLSEVTRPRSTPLLTPVHTKNGEKFVWSTFSDDQIDVNFRNLDVLFEYLDIFFFYLSKGLSVIRLDAVAFIWKKIGSNCIHLKETHEIVKLMRTLVDCFSPKATIITETNVPHKENISYFGDGDETHMVYQFSLPPLLLHAILTENAFYLTKWVKSLDKLPENCTYFNFTSSHDGIGVRPLEGLVPQNEFNELVEGVKKKGGFVSEKKNPDGTLSPYELNITYFDAFTVINGSQSKQERRYMCSQILAVSLKGVPGIYFHNFTATRNNLQGVSITGRYRTINRKKWSYDELTSALSDPDTTTARIFSNMKEVISLRKKHPAFHPFGGQEAYDIDDRIFCLLRWDPDKTEKVLVLANVTGENVKVDLKEHPLPLKNGSSYNDILSGNQYVSNGEVELPPYKVIWIKV